MPQSTGEGAYATVLPYGILGEYNERLGWVSSMRRLSYIYS